MGVGLSTGLAILSFIIVIGPLILAHELGHFWAARAFRIQVEEFGFGYPPRLLTLFERKGTKYTLNLLPMGGFMRPAGEDDPSVVGGLSAASKLARFSVLAAGPAANVVVAYVLLVVMYLVGAPHEIPGALIVNVVPDTPAYEAGLLADDQIVGVDGILIVDYGQLSSYIREHTGELITLQIVRGGEPLDIDMTPRTEWPEGQGPTGIELATAYEIQRYGPLAALVEGARELGRLVQAFVEFPARVIRENIPARLLRPLSVVGISQLGGQAMEISLEENAVWPVIQLAAIISLALALTNILPLPALDGGRILFVLIEALRGKRVKAERESLIHFVGFALLILAMAVFMVLDIVDPLVQ
jgi:regulator of sigma E protease